MMSKACSIYVHEGRELHTKFWPKYLKARYHLAAKQYAYFQQDNAIAHTYQHSQGPL
jgi:hypothetical protein